MVQQWEEIIGSLQWLRPLKRLMVACGRLSQSCPYTPSGCPAKYAGQAGRLLRDPLRGEPVKPAGGNVRIV